VGGCANQIPSPPKSPAEVDLRGQSYPRRTIVLYNLQRALDSRLAPSKRVDSVKVIARLGAQEPELPKDLAVVLTEPDLPLQVQHAVLEFLLNEDYPDLAGHIAAALADTKPNHGLREAILVWLEQHGEPGALAEVVKVWAQEPNSTGPNEPRFRQIVERATGKQWDKSLLEAINTPSFFARGSAIEILTRRIPETLLRLRISRIRAETDTMAAVQMFIDRFGFLPTDRAELLATVSMYKTRRETLEDARRLGEAWAGDYGYQFNIRDFHLLDGLARDPLRPGFSPGQLVMELEQAFVKRRHVHYAAGSSAGLSDMFTRHVDNLTMSDLWNLYLLNEMLCRSRVHLALRIMADRDRADRRSAWGGLVFYENGQAEAKLYRLANDAGGNDLRYVPSRRAIIDGRDALCRFNAHFEKIANAERAGPSLEELHEARRGNYYGLVLTSLSKETFCAHYYNPRGIVISLGVFLFAR